MDTISETGYVTPCCRVIVMQSDSSFLALSGVQSNNEKFNNQTSYTGGNNSIWQ